MKGERENRTRNSHNKERHTQKSDITHMRYRRGVGWDGIGRSEERGRIGWRMNSHYMSMIAATAILMIDMIPTLTDVAVEPGRVPAVDDDDDPSLTPVDDDDDDVVVIGVTT